MNKTIVAIILIISLFLLSCGQKTTVPAGVDPNSEEYETYAACVNQCSTCETDCVDTVYLNKAVFEQNKNACDRITSEEVKEQCEQQLLAVEAVTELNKEKCSMLIDPGAQENCLVHVAVETALESNNIAKCSDVENVERCQSLYYREMAISSGDASYCTMITDQEKQALCTEIVEEITTYKNNT